VLYSTPLGYNGETEFHWVMRWMYPSTSGLIMGTHAMGESTEMSHSYAIDASEIDPDKLRAIVFIQRYTTKEIEQAARFVEGSTTTGIETRLI
jgi:hypothetical protein